MGSQYDLRTVGGRLRSRRLALKLTQMQLSAKAGIGQSAISSIEGGDTKWLRGPTLLKLALALDVEPAWLLDGAGPMQATNTPPDHALTDVWPALTPDNKRRLVALARGLLADQTGVAYPTLSTPSVLIRPSVDDPYPLAPVPPHRRKAKKTTP